MTPYAWNAKDYEKNSRAQLKWAKELIGKLSLTGTEDVLDVGCGDGKITAEIARLLSGGTVTGIDASGPMIDLAEKQYPANRYPNLSFIVMDARNLLFESGFDVVFSNAALHWIKDHKPVVQGLYQSLRPGGKILLQMGGKGNAKQILSIIDHLKETPEWQPYFKEFEFPYGFLDIGDYEPLLLDAGFQIHRLELIPKDMVYDQKDGLEGWIRTTWLPYTQRLPEQKQERFIKEIVRTYVEKAPAAPDGKIHVAMVRLEVEAKKKAGHRKAGQ